VRPDPGQPPAPADPAATDAARLVARDKRALGRAISLCEDARAEAAAGRARLIAQLAAHPERRRALLVGVTGPPASGKSTLVAEVALGVVALRPEAAVAVLAVDPTSPTSGGALLGDRVRARFPPGDSRLFFRSQASCLELGGLGRHTFSVCRLLQHLFDVVFVETVGVGQSEVDVHRLVDRTYLVLPPAWGDGVQLMKAGILEIPDAVVLSKQDLEVGGGAGNAGAAAGMAGSRSATGSGQSGSGHRSGGRLASGGSAGLAAALGRGPRPLAIHRVSAHTGSGLERLVTEVASMMAVDSGRAGAPLDGREGYFFGRWVQGEFGRRGLAALGERGLEPDRFVREAGGYDAAVAAFPSRHRCWLCD
jgi:LAO/AO transport system kinase